MKVLISILVLLIMAAIGLGGFFVWNMYGEQQALLVEEKQQQEEEAALRSGGKSTLGRMRPPKNHAEVINNLSYAIEKNHDAVGWLEVPGTDINNVVMQSDDNRYYERRDEDGNDEIYGCYYMDYECQFGGREEIAPNTVVYGHSDLKDSPDGPRFSQLFRFSDIAFAKDHPYMYLTSIEDRYTFEIFAVLYTDINFDYIQVNMDDSAMLKLAQQAKALSLYDYGVEPALGDKLLTLSTCSVKYGADGNQRFVVMGRLCPQGFEEKESVELAQVIREP